MQWKCRVGRSIGRCIEELHGNWLGGCRVFRGEQRALNGGSYPLTASGADPHVLGRCAQMGPRYPFRERSSRMLLSQDSGVALDLLFVALAVQLISGMRSLGHRFHPNGRPHVMWFLYSHFSASVAWRHASA